jgi:comEA protein
VKQIRAIAVFLALLLAFALVGSLAAQKHLPAAAVDLNAASLEQLQELPGVGPSTAQAIVDFREKSGAFKRPEDLLAIHGISKAKFEKLRPYIVVKPAASGAANGKH